MCGIIGTVTRESKVKQSLLVEAEKYQIHRGPDAQGIKEYNVNNWQIAMGHQRLSILDLSPSGNQPMVSKSGRSCLIYNGEIYNYCELQQELESLGYSFVGKSDTEVILYAIEEWGIEKALSMFNGMWSFAWLDMQNNNLIIARDRMGIKPLYFFQDGDNFYFASEIKSILKLAGKKFKLNYQVVGEYLLQSLLDTGNDTFFQDIYKCPPSTFGFIDLREENLSINFKSYWNFQATPLHSRTESEYIDQARELFRDSVKIRLRSDVPVGVLLSGGLDSSCISTMMQNIMGSESQLNLISAVSDNSQYDESKFIDIMGNYLNLPINKVFLQFSPLEALNYLQEVSWFNDEPIGSFSTVAHYLLMKKAKELGVTVILSGQGADELLCGYRKYLGFYLQHLVTHKDYQKALKTFLSFFNNQTVISQFSLADAKRYLPMFKNNIDVSGENLKDFVFQSIGLSREMSVSQRQLVDVKKYSVPCLLHYEDRMSMAWSREIRLPFLDHRLVEFLLSLPTEMKLQKGWTKYIFRKAFDKYLPKEITWRKDKQGFINPQNYWLKKELKSQTMEYFEGDSLMFKGKLVAQDSLLKRYKIYCQQQDNKGSISYKDIFNPLALEVWLRKFEPYISL